MNNQQKITDNSNKTWSIANDLRGTMDASEFKHYVLGFIFYRYLSEHQEAYLAKEKLLEVKDGQSLNSVYKELTNDEATLSTYRKFLVDNLGYAIDPEYTWQSLIEKIDNDSNELTIKFYEELKGSFEDNSKKNQNGIDYFVGVFADLDLDNNKLGPTPKDQAVTLNKVVKKVNDIEFKGEDGQDIIGAIYEDLIGKFAASAGKKGGEFYTPHAVSKILARIVAKTSQDKKELTVYDPTCGSGSLLLTVGHAVAEEFANSQHNPIIKYYGQEKNFTTYNLARMNLMMHDVNYQNMFLNQGDTLGEDWPVNSDQSPRLFDAVVANPPYSLKWDGDKNRLKDPRFKEYGAIPNADKADFAFIQHSLHHLSATGTMAIVLPHGVLFRDAEKQIRKVIIEKNYLHAVIGLPEKLFFGTTIPTCILVFKKDKPTQDVLFIDAKAHFVKGKKQNFLSEEHINNILSAYEKREDIEKFAHLATLEEIQENDYKFNLSRYVNTFEEEPLIDLEGVLDQIEADKAEIASIEAEINAELELLNVKKRL